MLSVNLLAYLDIHVTATKQKPQNYFLRNLIFSKIVSYDKLKSFGFPCWLSQKIILLFPKMRVTRKIFTRAAANF